MLDLNSHGVIATIAIGVCASVIGSVVWLCIRRPAILVKTCVNGFLRNAWGDFHARWSMAFNPKSSLEMRVFAALELFCFPVSLLTVFGLLPLGIILPRFGVALPPWWGAVNSVMLSAAVGYITNWIAIEMLFKPYERSAWHPLSLITLGYWKQGLVSKNKDRIGAQLGSIAEEKLLDPRKIADDLCGNVMEIIQKPEIVDQIRKSVTKLMRAHSDAVIDYVAPRIEESLTSVMDAMLTAERATAFWEDEVEPYMQREESRAFIAGRIIDGLKRHVPEFTAMMKSEVRQMSYSFLKSKLPAVAARKLSDGLVSFINWADIESRLAGRLSEEHTQQMLRDELRYQVQQLGDWMRSPEAAAKIGRFIEAMKAKFRQWLRDYLSSQLPRMAQEAIGSDNLWNWVKDKFLPEVKPELEQLIRGYGKDQLLAKLRLSERISEAVKRQDIRQFHGMINGIAAQHLGAIQVMGYILGLLIGALQLLLK